MNTPLTGQPAPPNEQFIGLLRTALRRLYDNNALRTSPLVAIFGLMDEPDPPAALRQLLIAAIRALQPQAGTPADTQLWRVYEVLLYRYVQRSTQVEVAEQLGLSVRHLSRLEKDALEVLCRHLPNRHEPEEALVVDQELAWLTSAGQHETVTLHSALAAVSELARPLAAQNNVRLVFEDQADLSAALRVHPVALRQILLSLVSSAIRCATGRVVMVSVSEGTEQTCVCVRCAQEALPASATQRLFAPDLDVIRSLTAACGGRLTLHDGASGPVWQVCLPAVRQVQVLAIDDNPTTLELLRRYATGTHYRVTGTQHFDEGLTLAHELSPGLIVLDVMMPDMDGWEALGRLRQHPWTSHIPVIICTILPEEELALTLGASGFCRKPVTREGFLQALDQVGLAAQASG
jgi:CheY-like chemotaxis protein